MVASNFDSTARKTSGSMDVSMCSKVSLLPVTPSQFAETINSSLGFLGDGLMELVLLVAVILSVEDEAAGGVGGILIGVDVADGGGCVEGLGLALREDSKVGEQKLDVEFEV